MIAAHARRPDDLDDLSFDTLAVHAGAEPDELTGRGRAADLPDLDLRPGRGRQAAPRLRVRALAEPDPRAPRAGGRGARGRARTGSPSRRGRRRRPRSPSWPSRATRSSSATTSTAARIATSSGSAGRAAASRRRTSTSRPGMDALWEALSERTRLVWFETPTNPLLKIVDIAAVGARPSTRRAAEGGRRPLIVVDNTFASPAIQRPLTLGADIVFHSATKYLAGHSDTILGVAVTSDDAIAERLRFLQNAMGAVPGPLDCFLVLRGLRTLHLRVERHQAERARRSPRSCAGRDGRRRGALSGVRRDGLVPARGRADRAPAAERAIAIAEGTRLFTLAESLGGVESLIEVPAAMTHMSVAGVAARGRPGARPAVGRHRGRRRPDRRPAPGARQRLGDRRRRTPPTVRLTTSVGVDLPFSSRLRRSRPASRPAASRRLDRHEGLAGPGRATEPRGDVDVVAERGEIDPLLITDYPDPGAAARRRPPRRAPMAPRSSAWPVARRIASAACDRVRPRGCGPDVTGRKNATISSPTNLSTPPSLSNTAWLRGRVEAIDQGTELDWRTGARPAAVEPRISAKR